MEKKGSSRQRVVLVLPPFQGHMTPMLQVGTLLHSKGFSITVAHTEFNPPIHSNHPDFFFLPLWDNLSEYDTTFWNMLEVLKAINVNCRAPLKDYLVRIMEEKQEQVNCIIYDTLMYFADDVANDVKVPTIILRTTSASYLLACHAVPQLLADGYLPFEESLSHEIVPKLHPFRYKDIPVPEFTKDIIKLNENSFNPRSSKAMIWNTMDFLEDSLLLQLQQNYQIPVFPVGPLHKMALASPTSLLKEDESCITWLDKQAPNSVLYISLGSLASMDENELAEWAWGLGNSDQPFLWVIRPSSVRGSEWIELLPEGFEEAVGERGLIVKWAPQKKVLAHSAVGGFWSHCGWNSTLESLGEGVPMICRPCFADQLTNARYLTHVWEVGLELEHELERTEIEKAIRTLMVDTKGDEMRKRAAVMRQQIESCVKKGGSSYNSFNDLIDFITCLDAKVKEPHLGF